MGPPAALRATLDVSQLPSARGHGGVEQFSEGTGVSIGCLVVIIKIGHWHFQNERQGRKV